MSVVTYHASRGGVILGRQAADIAPFAATLAPRRRIRAYSSSGAVRVGGERLSVGATIVGAGAIASGEAFGSPTVTVPSIVTGAGGIASGEAIGSPTLTRQATVAVTGAGGIASGEAFDLPTVTRLALVALSGAGGIASGEAIGEPAVSADGTYQISEAGGIASGEAIGAPTLTVQGLASVSGAGAIASGEAFGVPTVTVYTTGTGGAYPVEAGLDSAEVLRVLLAALSGRSTGIGTSTERYQSVDGTKDRITVTFDTAGNRETVVLDVTP